MHSCTLTGFSNGVFVICLWGGGGGLERGVGDELGKGWGGVGEGLGRGLGRGWGSLVV